MSKKMINRLLLDPMVSYMNAEQFAEITHRDGQK